MAKVMNPPEVRRGYYENGNVLYIEYKVNGYFHREDGPAYIDYYENGNVWEEEYWLNGEQLTKESWYNKLSTKQKVNILYRVVNEQS